MPKNKDLKRIVRRRMEKTGEPYTVARRRVQAERHRGLAADWRSRLDCVIVPIVSSQEEWQHFAHDPNRENLFPVTWFGPAGRKDRPDVLADMGGRIEILRQAVAEAGVKTIEAAWSFLRRTAGDPRILVEAKERLQRFGIEEVWRVLPEIPRIALDVVYRTADAGAEQQFRIVRCEHCGKKAGELNVGVLYEPTDDIARGAFERAEEVLMEQQNKHVSEHPECNTANVVVTNEMANETDWAVLYGSNTPSRHVENEQQAFELRRQLEGELGLLARRLSQGAEPALTLLKAVAEFTSKIGLLKIVDLRPLRPGEEPRVTPAWQMEALTAAARLEAEGHRMMAALESKIRGKAAPIRFFIPEADSPEHGEKIYANIKEFVGYGKTEFSDRRVFGIRWQHDGAEHEAKVGEPTTFNGEPVVAILYDTSRKLYHVCTPNRGVFRGDSIMAGEWCVQEVRYFDIGID